METRIENWNGYDIRFVNLDGETIQDVIDSMNEKQKNVMYYLIATAREENKEDSSMAHNAWDVQFSCST